MRGFGSLLRRLIIKFILEVDGSRAFTFLWGKLKHDGWD